MLNIPEFSIAPGVTVQAKPVEDDRVAAFQDLWVSYACVCHVHMDPTASMPPRTLINI